MVFQNHGKYWDAHCVYCASIRQLSIGSGIFKEKKIWKVCLNEISRNGRCIN
jgi:hypothetical protein